MAGLDYPGKLADLRSWFGDDAECLDYLDWLRWGQGWCCPSCGSVTGWRTRDGRYVCGGCRRRASVTAGTIFHGTRTPLTVWFEAAWLVSTSKAGTSALNLKRVLGLGSYQTAWTMLHRYRTVMVDPGRAKLSGIVEVDETFVGGKNKPGKPGRGAAGKTLVVGAVERRGARFGRARLAVIGNAKSPTLQAFLQDSIEPGSTVRTDGLGSYVSAVPAAGMVHEPVNVKRSGVQAHQLLPGIHLLFSLLKRWLAGTHQSAFDTDHLPAYLDEFIFRFNRRGSRQRGLVFFRLLEAAVAGDPVTYRDIVANPAPTGVGTPPAGARAWPGTLARPPAHRPWRALRT